MNDLPNTLFLRLEGSLQAWGDPSKFVIRRTMGAPTKSGVIGLICCAMGYSRQEVVQDPIPCDGLRKLAHRLISGGGEGEGEPRRALLDLLNTLQVGVRVDREGDRWWDYHTVGAKVGLLKAEGGIKRTASTKEIETLITRREYLADASFLVALRGDASLIQKVADTLKNPKWPIYLGRKSCPPCLPVFPRPREDESWTNPTYSADLMLALRDVPWCPRYEGERLNESLLYLIEWRPEHNGDNAPAEAHVWYDVPISFDPPYHAARFVTQDSAMAVIGRPQQQHVSPPGRARTDYGKTTWGKIRDRRIKKDEHLCVFCKMPLGKYNSTVQHLDYRNAGVDDNRAALSDDRIMEDRLKHLRSLCRLCHDAVTMIEYGLGMGLDRINPEDQKWRHQIIQKREEIIKFRSLETRRRRLRAEEVE